MSRSSVPSARALALWGALLVTGRQAHGFHLRLLLLQPGGHWFDALVLPSSGNPSGSLPGGVPVG